MWQPTGALRLAEPGQDLLQLGATLALRGLGQGPDRLDEASINIFYSDEDEGYIADIPDLEACSAFGESPEQALAEVEKAKAAWLATARELQKPIPSPRYRPVIYQTAG